MRNRRVWRHASLCSPRSCSVSRAQSIPKATAMTSEAGPVFRSQFAAEERLKRYSTWERCDVGGHMAAHDEAQIDSAAMGAISQPRSRPRDTSAGSVTGNVGASVSICGSRAKHFCCLEFANEYIGGLHEVGPFATTRSRHRFEVKLRVIGV